MLLQEGGRMRRQVKGKRIKRPFGCSWVEVDGAVHRFVIEDTTHMKSMRSSSMRQQWWRCRVCFRDACFG